MGSKIGGGRYWESTCEYGVGQKTIYRLMEYSPTYDLWNLKLLHLNQSLEFFMFMNVNEKTINNLHWIW